MLWKCQSFFSRLGQLNFRLRMLGGESGARFCSRSFCCSRKQFRFFRIGNFRLTGFLCERGDLPIQKLIAQFQHDIGTVLFPENRNFVGLQVSGFGDQDCATNPPDSHTSRKRGDVFSTFIRPVPPAAAPRFRRTSGWEIQFTSRCNDAQATKLSCINRSFSSQILRTKAGHSGFG